MLKLLSSLPILLTENGQVFICGYGKGTNQEIYNIINHLVDRNSLKIDPTDDFISEEEIAEAARHYSSYRTVRLANKVIFYSADAVLGWWTNHNSYVEEAHQEVVLTLDKYFEKTGLFLFQKMFWESSMNPNDFTYTSYKSLLKTLLKSRANLCFKDLAEGKPKGNFLILRHDVDFSPEAALRMAKFEADMGLKATYFLLFSCPYYNLLSSENILFPRRLTDMGHEVGLHYDVDALEAVGNENLHNIFSRQIGMLSRLADTEIRSIAMHNPSLLGMDPFRETDFINAYDDKYTKEVSYFSDSCGAWRDEFVQHLEMDDFPMQMQLLIHPIFWGKTSLSRWERLDRFIHNNIDSLANSAKLVKELWSNHSGVIQHDERRQVARSK